MHITAKVAKTLTNIISSKRLEVQTVNAAGNYVSTTAKKLHSSAVCFTHFLVNFLLFISFFIPLFSFHRNILNVPVPDPGPMKKRCVVAYYMRMMLILKAQGYWIESGT